MRPVLADTDSSFSGAEARVRRSERRPLRRHCGGCGRHLPDGAMRMEPVTNARLRAWRPFPAQRDASFRYRRILHSPARRRIGQDCTVSGHSGSIRVRGRRARRRGRHVSAVSAHFSIERGESWLCARVCRCTTCTRPGSGSTGCGAPSPPSCARAGSVTCRMRSSDRAITTTHGGPMACFFRRHAGIPSQRRGAPLCGSSRLRTTRLPVAKAIDTRVRWWCARRVASRPSAGCAAPYAHSIRSTPSPDTMRCERRSRRWREARGSSRARSRPAPTRGASRRSGDGRADVCAVDCVTWALLARHRPSALHGLRVIALTEPMPGLPLVTRRRLLRRDPRCHSSCARARLRAPGARRYARRAAHRRNFRFDPRHLRTAARDGARRCRIGISPPGVSVG